MKNTILLLIGLLSLLLLATGCADDTEPDTEAFDHICTDRQKSADICTANYDPVCGSNGVTYSNNCVACSAKIDAYNAGACEAQVLDHVCSQEEKDTRACTKEYIPVCGSDSITYGNGCAACAANNAGWTRGEC